MSQNLIKLISATTPNLEEQWPCGIPKMESGEEVIYQGRGVPDILRKHENSEVFFSHEECIVFIIIYLYLLFWGIVFNEESTGEHQTNSH